MNILYPHTHVSRLSPARVLILSLVLVAFPARALELFLSGQVGFDSNPLKLADSFSPDDEIYLSADAYIKHRFENGFFVKAHMLERRYPWSGDADWNWARFTPGYRSTFELDDKKIRYELWFDYTTFDLVYIDKDTGQPGVFNGASIADRFDSSYVDTNARFEHRTEADTRLEFGVQFRNKDYKNIEVNGLSDLDYRHDQIYFGAELRPDDKYRYSARYILTDREYLDRRADDLEGNDIPGTDLEFKFKTLELSYRYQPNEQFRLIISYSVENQEDNASGFWDAETDDLKAEFRFAVKENQTLDFRIRLREKAYEQNFDTSQISAEEESRDTDNRSIRLRFTERQIQRKTDELSYYLELESENVDSNDPNDEYDRLMLGAGILWQYR